MPEFRKLTHPIPTTHAFKFDYFRFTAFHGSVAAGLPCLKVVSYQCSFTVFLLGVFQFTCKAAPFKYQAMVLLKQILFFLHSDFTFHDHSPITNIPSKPV